MVLAEQEKEGTQDIIFGAMANPEGGLRTLGSEIIVRSGNPLMEHQLRKVNANSARSIIALSPEGMEPDEADAHMVMQILTLRNLNVPAHVVAEVQDNDNTALVRKVRNNQTTPAEADHPKDHKHQNPAWQYLSHYFWKC